MIMKGNLLFFFFLGSTLSSLSLYAQQNQDPGTDWTALESLTSMDRDCLYGDVCDFDFSEYITTMNIAQLESALTFEERATAINGSQNNDRTSGLYFELAKRHLYTYLEQGEEDLLVPVIDNAERALAVAPTSTEMRLEQLRFLGSIYYDLRIFDNYDLLAFEKLLEAVELDPSDRYTSILFMDLTEAMGLASYAYERAHYFLLNDTVWFLDELAEKYIILAATAEQLDASMNDLNWLDFQFRLGTEAYPDRLALLSAGLHVMRSDLDTAHRLIDGYEGDRDDPLYLRLRSTLEP